MYQWDYRSGICKKNSFSHLQSAPRFRLKSLTYSEMELWLCGTGRDYGFHYDSITLTHISGASIPFRIITYINVLITNACSHWLFRLLDQLLARLFLPGGWMLTAPLGRSGQNPLVIAVLSWAHRAPSDRLVWQTVLKLLLWSPHVKSLLPRMHLQ